LTRFAEWQRAVKREKHKATPRIDPEAKQMEICIFGTIEFDPMLTIGVPDCLIAKLIARSMKFGVLSFLAPIATRHYNVDREIAHSLSRFSA